MGYPHKEMSGQEIVDLLLSEKIGRLATVKDNIPYVVPLNFVYIKGKIYLHCATTGKKLDNIKANSSVCFQVDDNGLLLPADMPCSFTYRYKSVMIIGRAAVVDDPEERFLALNELVKKYDEDGRSAPLAPEMMESTTVVAIEVHSMTGRKNKF